MTDFRLNQIDYPSFIVIWIIILIGILVVLLLGIKTVDKFLSKLIN